MKWYHRPWAAILFLFVFAPVGIFLMFKYQKWKFPVKVVCSVVFGVMFLAMYVNALNSPKEELTSPLASVTTRTTQGFTLATTTKATPTPEVATKKATPMPKATPESTPEVTPKPTPTPELTTEPTSTPEPTPEVTLDQSTSTDAAALVITSAPSIVHRNENATITAVGEPNTEYRCRVHYSDWSDASGLGDKTSDGNGNVSWTWKIGGRTSYGNHYAEISGGGETITHDFSVVE